MPDTVALPFSGPAAVSLARTAPLWPLSPLPIEFGRIELVNTGTADLEIASVQCSPQRDSDSGISVSPRLEAVTAQNTIRPGDKLSVQLRGEVPAEPGSYQSNLRIAAKDGAPFVLPVTITVKASPWRGLACTLLGLLVAGIIGMLQSQSDLHARRAEISQASADAMDWRRRNPIPSSLAAAWDAYDADVQAAQLVLTQPRPLSVVDWRIPLADGRQRAAEDELKTIKDAMKDAAPGAAEVSELNAAWKSFQGRLQTLATRSEGVPGAVPSSFAGRLASFLTALKTPQLVLPMQAAAEEIGTQVTLTDLLLDGGQPEAARQRAVIVRGWLELAAQDLNQRLNTLANYENLVRSLLVQDAALRGRLADSAVAEQDRTAIGGALDKAEMQIGPNMQIEQIASLSATFQQAETGLLRVEVGLMFKRVAAAQASVQAETDQSAVNAAMGENPPAAHDPPDRKIEWTKGIIAAWRGIVGKVADPPTRQDFQNRLDAIDALLAKGDLMAVREPFKQFTQAWADYGLRRLTDTANAAETTFCRQFGADLRRKLDDTEVNLRALPELAPGQDWQSTLERIRLQASQWPDEGCLAVDVTRQPGGFSIQQKPATPLFDLAGQAFAVQGQVFTALLNAAPLAGTTRLRFAQISTVAEAIQQARQLLSSPRPLTLSVQSGIQPTAEQAVRFDPGNLDATWVDGVQIAVDYGDHTIEQHPLEAVRKDGLVHTYLAPFQGRVSVVAATGFQPRSLEPTDRALGTGGLDLTVAESPVNVARALADTFINARFALALAAALLVYVWQFQSKQPDFGRRGFDYVKAFALGFVVEAATANLADAFNKIVLG